MHIEQRNDEKSYVDAILQEAAALRRRRTSTSKYCCTNHVSTTNIAERANSQAKSKLVDRRSHMWSVKCHMHPETQQLIMVSWY